MDKYELTRRCLADVEKLAAENGLAYDDCLEALLVVGIEALAKAVGRDRAAATLRYELSSIGGGVDTAFIRSR